MNKGGHLKVALTKYSHSCLLVETPGRVSMIDPGVYSWNSEQLPKQDLPVVDRILITHAHPDHCHPEFVQALLERNPQAHIIANAEVRQTLQQAGVQAMYRDSSQCSVPFTAPHEELPLPGMPVPANNGFHFNGAVTHPGDSYHFSETMPILALPVIAPWGKTGDALQLVDELKPRYFVPIHDWHYSDAGREWLYGLLQGRYGDDAESVFVPLQDGERVELEI